MSKQQRYTVYSVLQDGNPYPVLTTLDPGVALGRLASEEALHRHRGHQHAHGIYDPDDGERGDIVDIAEAAVWDVLHSERLEAGHASQAR